MNSPVVSRGMLIQQVINPVAHGYQTIVVVQRLRSKPLNVFVQVGGTVVSLKIPT